MKNQIKNAIKSNYFLLRIYSGFLNVRNVFNDYSKYREDNITTKDKAELLIESVVLVFLVFALAFSIAAVGLIGLSVMVLLTAFKGITHEHKLVKHFTKLFLLLLF